MKKSNILAIIILIILIAILIGYLIYYQINNPTKETDCKNYSVDKCPSGCIVCPPCAECSSISCQSKDFCKSIGFNETWYTNIKPNYCTPEQKSAQICPEYYSATCGWFNLSIKCFKYPCAETFENPCFACADAKVEYYTIGECPK